MEHIYISMDSPGKKLPVKGKLSDIALRVLYLMGRLILKGMTAENLICG
jgi:bisphosphoglycerate-independent phosphoglycerate mutase (AlkP superfamily)